MEILWKVWYISFLLFILTKPTVNGGNETVTTEKVEDSTTESEDKPKGDLDLETQDQVAILKQINRVNDDGSYTFGYEAADGSFKIETRDVNGNVKGMFGFINEKGELKRVSYSASNGTGFQSTGTLNVPPLPGTVLASEEESSRNFYNNGHLSYEQFVRPKSSGEDSSTKINLLEATTANYEVTPEITPSKLPIYIYGSSTARNELTSSVRPVVIQHIPKVRPTPATSSTAPTESEEILHKPLFADLSPKRTSNGNFISFGTQEISSTTSETPVTEEGTKYPSVIQVIRPRTGPYKKVIVTKRPIATTTPKVVTTTEYQSKEYLQKLKEKETASEVVNEVRKELEVSEDYVTPTQSGLVTSGTEDSPDVYGSGHTPRPYPANAYRALFSQIPQHQRILQNSYIQNQNQYLTAAFGNQGIAPQGVPQNFNQGRTFSGTPLPPNIPIPQDTRQNNYVPVPEAQPVLNPQGHRQFEAQPNYPRPPLPPVSPPIASPYNPEQVYNPLYIPPGLIEQIIRMLLIAQYRQRQHARDNYHHGMVAALGTNNVPPEIVNPHYHPPFYQPPHPYPNYSQVSGIYAVPMIPRPNYDPSSYYQAPIYLPDPRYNYHSPTYSPLPYSRFQQRIPAELDPLRQNEDFLFKTFLGPPRLANQVPVPPIQSPGTVVERSPVYNPGRDSTTSSTTPASRLGPVRNVQILGQISEDTEPSSNYGESTKSES